jgi:hypothetical protein
MIGSYWDLPSGIDGRNEKVVRWYWSFVETEGEVADHGCGPDCPCWAHARQLRGDDGDSSKI